MVENFIFMWYTANLGIICLFLLLLSHSIRDVCGSVADVNCLLVELERLIQLEEGDVVDDDVSTLEALVLAWKKIFRCTSISC